MSNNFYFVYLLLSEVDQDFYVGFTTNVERRLADHNCGHNPSTAHRRPFQLIFYEAYLSKIDALRREQYFKSSKGKAVLKLMLADYFDQKSPRLEL